MFSELCYQPEIHCIESRLFVKIILSFFSRDKVIQHKNVTRNLIVKFLKQYVNVTHI